MFERQCCDNNRQQQSFEANFTGDNMNVDMDVDMINYSNMNMQGGMAMSGTTSSPIMEPIQERQVHRTIVHEVPHVCPIRTRVINHHIYRHTYSPSYSCCEENTCSNVQCGSCSCFR